MFPVWPGPGVTNPALFLLHTYDGFAVAGSGLLVLAAEEQAVALLFELLGRGGALLRAAGLHLLHRLCGGRSPLLPNPVPRLFGWGTGRSRGTASPGEMPLPSSCNQETKTDDGEDKT